MVRLAGITRQRHHIARWLGVRSDSDAQCQPGGHCKKRYATGSLDKGHVSKLKCAMMEQLGKRDDWECVEKRGNPVATPIVRGYLSFVQREQRRVGVGVKQAPLLVAVQLRGIGRDAPTPTNASHCRGAHRHDPGCGRSLRVLPYIEARFRKIGSGGVAGAANGWRRGVHFHFFVWKMTLRSASQAMVVRKILDCHEICAFTAVVKYQQPAEPMQWPIAEGSGFLSQSVPDGGEKEKSRR